MLQNYAESQLKFLRSWEDRRASKIEKKERREKEERTEKFIYNLAKDTNGYNTRMNCVYLRTYPILCAESCYCLAERQIVHRVEIETNPGNDDIVYSKYGRVLNEAETKTRIYVDSYVSREKSLI